MPKKAISGAKQKIGRVREFPADYSALTTHEESLFLHQNDYWIIRYYGHSALLKSTRGLHCLAVLLRDPGREFHVSELLAVHGRVTGGLYAGITVMDAQAKAEYKFRLNELRQNLDEAKRFNDPLRRAEAQNEIHVITNRLASAVGFGGRDRETSSDAERARSAVTKRIRKEIEKISEAIPLLGRHLVASIKTGYFCSYNPHPDHPVAWKF